MLTTKQNLLETIHGGHPDRFVNQYEAFKMVFDPIMGTEPYGRLWRSSCCECLGRYQRVAGRHAGSFSRSYPRTKL